MRALAVLALLMAFVGCSSTASQLRGSWVMIESQGRVLEPESPPGPNDSVKTLSETHFAFGYQTEDGEVFGGGGSWFADGGIYVESVRYHSQPALRGQTVEFRCRIEGDLWFHEARFETGGRHYDIREVWKRLSAEES